MRIKKSLALAFAIAGTSPAAAADWSGLYLGVTGGYGTGSQTQRGGILTLPSSGGGGGVTSMTSTVASSAPPTSVVSGGTTTIVADGHYGVSGGLVGGAVGYNWQQGRVVYGIEGDGSWADVSNSGTCGFTGAAPHSCGGGIRSLGTIRGNVGFDISDFTGIGALGGMRVFAAGGLAVGQVHAYDSLFGGSGNGSLAGWTIGGGAEVMISPHWSVRAEYLHVDLGEHAFFTAIPPTPERVRTTAELVRIGVSYHFNAPIVGPVIAKY